MSDTKGLDKGKYIMCYVTELGNEVRTEWEERKKINIRSRKNRGDNNKAYDLSHSI